MSRLPVVTELAGGKSQRQRVWEAIRALSASAYAEPYSFSADDLSRRSKVEMPIVREYLLCLTAGGYLSQDASRPDAPGAAVKKSYRLTQDSGVEAPRLRRDGSPVQQGRGTEAMWAAITALEAFTHHMLAEIAQVKPSTAANYCGFLGRAGYLDLVLPGKGTGRGGVSSIWCCAVAHRYKPRAPMITRLKSVYDPNTHQIVWQAGADAAADMVESGEVVE